MVKAATHRSAAARIEERRLQLLSKQRQALEKDLRELQDEIHALVRIIALCSVALRPHYALRKRATICLLRTNTSTFNIQSPKVYFLTNICISKHVSAIVVINYTHACANATT